MASTVMYERGRQLWTKFHDELLTYPIFIINCHSALCIDYNMCIGPGGTYRKQPQHNNFQYGSIQIPSFTVEPDTYIWSIAGAGEGCYNNISLDRAIAISTENFRKALTVTSLQDDIKPHPETPRGLIRNSTRATNCVYPNISCTFVEDKDQLAARNGVNALGVFRIKNPGVVFDNSSLGDIGNSIGYCMLSDEHSGPYGNKDWFLSDIIEYVYSIMYPSPRWVFTKPKRKGIFIFSGCVTPIRSYESALKHNSSITLERHMRYVDGAEVLINNNNLEYSSKKPTMDIKQINSFLGFEEFKITDARIYTNPTTPNANALAGVNAATEDIHALAAASSVPSGPHIVEDDDS
jgi:hypothetical protein